MKLLTWRPPLAVKVTPRRIELLRCVERGHLTTREHGRVYFWRGFGLSREISAREARALFDARWIVATLPDDPRDRRQYVEAPASHHGTRGRWKRLDRITRLTETGRAILDAAGPAPPMKPGFGPGRSHSIIFGE